ncbi:hypothetical protein AJ79_08999 [Helicocarpus griseus UAMH5409]|uniref:DUF4048 domain-containing protein n=1 Tax=Helicocarpus griseus UAMH5409 TaxID=1447875 RepID=A0A2B7WNK3_9EURO|nr:hypothetical protein AJ79_08999 [Helicocarpus griseus UAMH5409]
MDEASTAPAAPQGGEHGRSSSFENPRQAKRASLPLRPNVAARHSKRLTLNFPISATAIAPEAQGDAYSPASSVMSPAAQASVLPSPRRSSASTPTLFDTNDDGYDFLTALAAQERKVLELKEELHRAEAELITLKRQWALAEKSRKRTEIFHHAEVLKPLKNAEQSAQQDGSNSPQTDQMTTVPSHARMSRELERRHSYRNSQSSSPGDPPSTITSSKGRTVFQGSKHTRTLSLLSTGANSDYKPSFHQPKDISGSEQSANSRSSRYPRSATLPSVDRTESIRFTNETNTTGASAEQKAQWRRTLPPIPQDVTADVLMKTGRQMASDFREGLWTFFEDIRQATVGEEGINGTESRSSQRLQSGQSGMKREGSVASTRTGRSQTSRGVENSTSGKDSTSKAQEISFWSEFGIDTPDQRTKSPQSAESPSRGSQQQQQGPGDSSLLDVDDEDENWDMWDTPQPKAHTPSSSSSTFLSKRDHSPSTEASSPRTSASFTNTTTVKDEPEQGSNKRDSIPWPALTKLHPSKLTRTASNLMDEWERSLTHQKNDKL